MFPIPDCSRSMGLHVLLAIAFGTAEFPVYGNTIHANEACLNVSDEIICYFKASEKHMNWSEATHLCRVFKSTLPVIRNENDQVAVASYIRSDINNNDSWTAGKNFTYNTWTWINGESFKEVKVPTEETYTIDESAQEVKKDSAAFETDFTFTALPASDELPYICQYKGISGAYCNSSIDIVMIATDNCLRLINDSRTWYDARNHCFATKGDLAVIGMAERDILRELKLNQSYWIGLRKHHWLWILNDNVESKDEIKYTNWHNAFATDGECISIDVSGGKWKAIGCGESKAVTVVCQRGQGVTSPTVTTEASPETTHTFTLVSEERTTVTGGSQSFTQNGFLFAVVGVGIVILICIIVIIVFVLRTRNGRSGKSKLNDGYVQNNREVLNTGITNAPVLYTSINEPADVPANGSDDIRGVYADIALLTSEQSDDGGINQPPGIVYASLDFKKDPTNLEPNQTPVHSTSSPTKVGPLGDIYAIPDAKGHAASSPSDKSASHPIKVTPQGDVYAIPMKISTSPTVGLNPPIGAVYANLPTAALDKEPMAVESDETK